ncbi:hypothetical protein JCM4814A_00960 [Streptomyces phaeofaciens JCM 4814]|uniref:Uncharacterized protein n=1 Tax=Streptomyces phaeofaciens TaxID=68254 RepID=A0A918HRC4_9ACTN|nr:hypothetical protein [Streptomyces phaeofaciens]GGT92107.1 hypothetical protein GCM10010226_82620 [Streptomyces phaeofaciens]
MTVSLAYPELATSIVRCCAELLSLNVAPDFAGSGDEIFSFGRGSGAAIAGVTIDSMELQEVLVTLETEFGIDLLGLDDLGRVASMDGLTKYVVQESTPERVRAFIERWAANA